MKRTLFYITLFFFGLSALATETQVMVRARAKDAKFIGSSIGGAYVIIRDQLTGEVLSSGITTGSTGNTTLLMKTPYERGTTLSDEKSAGFLATIDIDRPTYVVIEVTAPVNQKQSVVRATTEIWLIPGKHLLGDGIIVEIPGFVIDVLYPRAHQMITLESLEKGQLKIKANVVMMCGCPITEGGLWDATQMEVIAQVLQDNQLLEEVEMKVTATSLFEGTFTARNKDTYEIIVYAYNATTNNTGVDKVNFILY